MTEATPAGQPRQKLPVFKVVGEAYGSFFRHLLYLPQAALLPILLGAPLYWAYWQIVKPMILGAPGSFSRGLLLVLIYLVLIFTFIIFCVAWYRLELLGPDRGRPPLFPLPRRRHWRFLGYTLLIFLIYFAIALVFGVLPMAALAPEIGPEGAALDPAAAASVSLLLSIWWLVLFCVILFIMLRLSFVFPAVSVDEAYSLSDSWRHTKGQALRFFAALFLVSIPPVVVIMVFSLATTPDFMMSPEGPAGMSPEQVIAEMEDYFLYSISVGYVLGLCYWAIVIGAVVAAFKGLTGWYPEPESAAPTVPADSLTT
ncbi:MAG: hypothetical protein QNJ30_26245 [Kiloniellales bacterium]|nr:hypothetical protein [Kiloniellales bacterium]